LAKKSGGTFVLRIEDTDVTRSEERFEDLIFEDLQWLGMQWQEGPDVGGDFGPYRQSDRIQIYKDKAAELKAVQPHGRPSSATGAARQFFGRFLHFSVES
jgi:glutamyl/glutaminyl-tRNA synthetase